MDFIRTDIKRYRLRRSDIWGTLWGCDAPAVLSNWKYRDSIKSRGAKNARDRVRGVFMTNCFVHMIEFEQGGGGGDWILGSGRPDTHNHTRACMYTWLEQAQRIILGHFRHTLDTIDRRAYRSQISMFWSALDEDQSCGEVKHHGGKIFNFWFVRNSGGIARGYSFDIRFTPWVEIFQGGYSEHSFWRVDILTIFRAWFSFQLARAHWLPNQGSSRPALVSRLKLDRVPLMGIRVEFETERQCLHWSAIEKTKFCSVSIFLFERRQKKVRVRDQMFLSPWFGFDRQGSQWPAVNMLFFSS